MVTQQKENTRTIPSPGSPTAVAEWLVKNEFVYAGGNAPTLVGIGDSIYQWTPIYAWQEISERTLKTILYRVLQHAVCGQGEDTRPWNPNASSVSRVMEALRAAIQIDLEHTSLGAWTSREILPGTWLHEDRTDTYIHMADGILRLRDRELFPHDPRFFTQTALTFAWKGATGCDLWLKTLHENFGDDDDADRQIELLQEWMGYLVSGQTSLQKAMWLWGLPRSGKGLIVRMCAALVGQQNFAGLSSASLSVGGSALSPAIGKSLCSISDARLDGRTARKAVEAVLMWTGEDHFTIDRKYMSWWTGAMSARLMFASNEPPKFVDASPAVMNRFVVLQTRASNLGKEDPDLFAKLTAELPGILRWALDGLDRLTSQGRFTVTSETRSAIEEGRRESIPLIGFLEEEVDITSDPEDWVDRKTFFDRLNAYREDLGYGTTTMGLMKTDISAAGYRNVSVRRLRDGDGRKYVVTGVKFREPNWRAAPTPGGTPDTPTEAGEPALTEFQENLLRVCADRPRNVADVLFEAGIPADQKGYTTKTLNGLARDGLLVNDASGYRATAVGRAAIGTAKQLDLEGAGV